MPFTECPSCRCYFETSGKREILECPRCEVTFPSPESLGIPEIREEIKARLLERAANPRTPHTKNIIERLHDEAIKIFLARTREILPQITPEQLDINRDTFYRDAFKVDKYKAEATLWKGLLYDPRKIDAQINIHFTDLYIDICIWHHKKGEPMFQGWDRAKAEDRISPWDQMVLDGDIPPQMAAICLAPYKR